MVWNFYIRQLRNDKALFEVDGDISDELEMEAIVEELNSFSKFYDDFEIRL